MKVRLASLLGLACAALTCRAFDRDAYRDAIGYQPEGGTPDDGAIEPPADAGPPTRVLDFGVAYHRRCAVLESGIVRCVGYNADGGLGDGTTIDSIMPVSAIGITDATRLL